MFLRNLQQDPLELFSTLLQCKKSHEQHIFKDGVFEL